MTNLFDKVKVSCALLVAGLAVAAGKPRVENVLARQVSNTKDVEVTYDLVAPDGGDNQV